MPNVESRKHMALLLAALAQQSGEKVEAFRLEFLARKLEPLGLPQVCAALEKLLESSRRFPTVAEVKAAMGIAEPTALDAARQLADTLANAVVRYGEIPPGNVKTALAIEHAVGPAAWALAQRTGGWNALVDRLAENQLACRAQLRDSAQSLLQTGGISAGQLPGKLPTLADALGAVAARPELQAAEGAELRLQLEAAKQVRDELPPAERAKLSPEAARALVREAAQNQRKLAANARGESEAGLAGVSVADAQEAVFGAPKGRPF